MQLLIHLQTKAQSSIGSISISPSRATALSPRGGPPISPRGGTAVSPRGTVVSPGVVDLNAFKVNILS